jgi:glycerol-3-phosphate acyltransferase PlsY
MLEVIIVLLISYLIGSFPTAIIAGKLIKNMDIREHGSGNAGATNVLRVLGWKAALIVLLIDMLKGFAAVYWIVNIIPGEQDIDTRAVYQILAGFAAIAGHIWTVFAGFKGGKGVGTAAGVFLGLQPLPVVICLIVFIAIVYLTRYVSLGSMTAACLLAIILLVEKFILDIPVPIPHVVIAIILAILILLMHRENIERLVHGKENKISFKKGENQ